MRQGLGKEENDHLGSKAEEDHPGSGFEDTEIVHRATSFGPQGRGSPRGFGRSSVAHGQLVA